MRHLLFLLLIVPTIVFSKVQKDSTTMKNLIKVDAIPLLDWVNTSARISYERRIGEHWSIQLGTGYCYNLWGGKFRADDLSKNNGFHLNAEVRYYITSRYIGSQPWFLGIRASKMQYEFTQNLRFYSDSLALTSIQKYHWEGEVRQEKEVSGIYLISGLVRNKGHFIFDFTGGIGLAQRYVNNEAPELYTAPYFGEAIRLAFSNSNANSIFFPQLYLQIKLGLIW